MSKRKPLLKIAILSIFVNYTSAADISVNFADAKDVNPSTATALNTVTTNGTWDTPLITGVVVTNKIMSKNWRTDLSNGAASFKIRLTFKKPLILNGSTFQIDLTKYLRVGADKGGAYVTGRDSSGRELFKLFLSAGQQLPTGLTLSSGSRITDLRCGLGYIKADNSCVFASQPSEDFMRNGGLHSVKLQSDGYIYSATSGDTGTTMTLSKTAYNDQVTNLATVEFHMFNEDHPAGFWIKQIVATQALTIDLKIKQTGTKLIWSTKEERDIKKYLIVNATTNAILETIIAGEASYATTLPEGVHAKVIVVNKSGYQRCFLTQNQ